MPTDPIDERAEGKAFGVDVQGEDAELFGLDLGGKGSESRDEELVFPLLACLGCLGCPLTDCFHVFGFVFPSLATSVG